MTKTLTASEAKNRFFDLLKGVSRREDEVVVTREGEPAAVLVSYVEFERLMETLELLSDPKAMARIRQGRRHLKRRGKLLTHRDIFP